ncbi:MAG: SGNH/GDSL hydrolase family protein, partial [Anaerolineae bacterium]
MPAPTEKVYLFAGDSLTEGVYGANYIEHVARVLAEDGSGVRGDLVNAGRGGDTAVALRHRMDTLVQRWQPGWVIVSVGCNDVWLAWLSSHSLGWRMWLAMRRLQTGQVPSSDLDQFAA